MVQSIASGAHASNPVVFTSCPPGSRRIFPTKSLQHLTESPPLTGDLFTPSARANTRVPRARSARLRAAPAPPVTEAQLLHSPQELGTGLRGTGGARFRLTMKRVRFRLTMVTGPDPSPVSEEHT